MRLSQQNLKILLNKEIEVVHLKEYSFISFLRNDFIIPYYWAKIFIRQRGWVSLAKKKDFLMRAQARLSAFILAGLTLPLLFVNPLISALFIILFLLLNLKFFIFLYRQGGAFFAHSRGFLNLAGYAGNVIRNNMRVYNMVLAPVVLFAYNRIEHLKKSVDSLKNNYLASESELFIFSDGPKNVKDKLKVDAVRAYLKGDQRF